MHDHADLNLSWAYAVFEGLRAAGVTRVIISPGSRSTPLALAAYRHPELETRVILDERTAAFFALGAARTEGRPTALVATSGTAITEWLPAVSEADLARVPLILLSADRPPELHRCGANQTLEQSTLLSPSTRFFMELPLPDECLLAAACQFSAQAAAAALWPLPGPVHLNIPFSEPLTPAGLSRPTGVKRPRLSRPVLEADPGHLDEISRCISGRPGLILCGPEIGQRLPAGRITALASSLGAPILADPLSNLRNGPHDRRQILALYDACLRQPSFVESVRPEWVLRFGAMPVSKRLTQYLGALEGARHILVDPGGRWPDPLHRTTDLIQADPAKVALGLTSSAASISGEYLRLWKTREQRVRQLIEDQATQEARIIDSLIRQLPAGSLLFSGNSLPIRQLDWFCSGRDEPLEIGCNRGASGIDGNIATLLGMAASGDRTLVGLLGDLTLMHDLGSLIEARGMRASILVLDNGGGAIFDHLPQAALDEHEALFFTPRSIDMESAAATFGLGYRQTSAEAFSQALEETLRAEGVQLLHIKLDRDRSLKEHQALWARLAE